MGNEASPSAPTRRLLETRPSSAAPLVGRGTLHRHTSAGSATVTTTTGLRFARWLSHKGSDPSGWAKTIPGCRRTSWRVIASRSRCCRRACASGCPRTTWRGGSSMPSPRSTPAAFYAAYRADGWGRAAHEPAMMVASLVYAYAIGKRSSRRIERHCEHDVAFRVIAANRVPDHATIARFRVRHERAIAFFDDNETWLARVLEDGRVDGRLQFDAPPPEAARLIVSALEGAMLVARAYGDVERFHAAATGLLATLTRPASAAP